MSAHILRRYALEELDGEGYPIEWHRPQTLTIKNRMGTTIAEHIEVPAIKDYIRELAGYRCVRCKHPYLPGISKTHPRGEWTPCDEECSHRGPLRGHLRGDETKTFANSTNYGGEAGGWVHVGFLIEAQWRILTVHHLNGDKANCLWWNLAALCQRCHLTIQGRVVMERAFILEHSDWFKPYAAGFYAMKYLNEDLAREETIERLEELLALERMA